MLSKIYNHEEPEVFAYLHRNLDPALTTAISDAKFPGLLQKTIDSIEECVNYKFITKFQDNLRTEWHSLRKALSVASTLWKLISYQLDLVKDTVLTITLLHLMGGPIAIYHFPTNFSSVIVMSFAVTIIVPMIFSTTQLAISNPYLIFLLMKKRAAKLHKIVMIFICMGFCSLNHIFLVLNYEETKENAVSRAKDFNEIDNNDVLELFEDCKMIKTEISEFLKIDLGKYCTYKCIFYLLPFRI